MALSNAGQTDRQTDRPSTQGPSPLSGPKISDEIIESHRARDANEMSKAAEEPHANDFIDCVRLEMPSRIAIDRAQKQPSYPEGSPKEKKKKKQGQRLDIRDLLSKIKLLEIAPKRGNDRLTNVIATWMRCVGGSINLIKDLDEDRQTRIKEAVFSLCL